jgi:hypothetical protein
MSENPFPCIIIARSIAILGNNFLKMLPVNMSEFFILTGIRLMITPSTKQYTIVITGMIPNPIGISKR